MTSGAIAAPECKTGVNKHPAGTPPNSGDSARYRADRHRDPSPTNNLEAAERFYTGAFGLRAARRFGADALELVGWPVPVFLLSKPAEAVGAGHDLRRYERHWTPIHPDVVVPHLGEAVQKALAAGAVLEDPPREAPYGRIAMMADPFGHGFCLIEFNTQGYDALCTSAP